MNVTQPVQPNPDETCIPSPPGFPGSDYFLAPSELIEPPKRQYVMTGGDKRADAIVTTGPYAEIEVDSEGRLVSWLRDAARSNVLAKLAMAAQARYWARFPGAKPPNLSIPTTENAWRALADLCVTGTRSLGEFLRLSDPLATMLPSVLAPITVLNPSAQFEDIKAAATDVLERAYQVAWALRGARDRSDLGWIAVSGEDDSPHRPVNVPSGFKTPTGGQFPQFDLDVPGPFADSSLTSLRTRYSIASVDMARGGPPGTSVAWSYPPEATPSISTDERVLLFIPGMSSRLEEASDIMPHLVWQDVQFRDRFTVIGMDLPCNGYSQMFDPKLAGPYSESSSGYSFPALRFIEQFIVNFVDELEKRLGVSLKNRATAVIGGSLGGNMGMRLAERNLPWLKNVVAWSPASVWNTFDGDAFKNLALNNCRGHAVQDELPDAEAELRRTEYFANVFYERIVFFKTVCPAQADMWWRDTWPCKPFYATGARLVLQEIYNQMFRLYHWRLALEQLRFSHLGIQDHIPIPYQAIRSTRVMLAAGKEDEFDYSDIFTATQGIAKLMTNVVGTTLFLDDTGHSIHDERPEALSREIRSFLPPPRVETSRCLAPSADGRLELFVVGSDGTLWHKWQVSPDDVQWDEGATDDRQATYPGTWTNWNSSGTPAGVRLVGAPALAPSADGRLELFVVGSEGALWHQWQLAPSGTWSGWNSSGAPAGVKLFGSPVLAPDTDGRLELFVLGSDGAFWHQTQTEPSGGWSDWSSSGAPPGAPRWTSPAIAAHANGQLQLFTVGSDGALWHLEQTAPNGGWSTWYSSGTPAGVTLSGTPAVSAMEDGRLEAVAVGSDGALWHQEQIAPRVAPSPLFPNPLEWILAQWSPWDSLGASTDVKLVSPPVLAPSDDGRLELFVVGTDGALWHKWQKTLNGDWSDWNSSGVPPQLQSVSSPILAPGADGCLKLFAFGSDEVLWTMRQILPSAGWGSWYSDDSDGGGAPPGVRFLPNWAHSPEGFKTVATPGQSAPSDSSPPITSSSPTSQPPPPHPPPPL